MKTSLVILLLVVSASLAPARADEISLSAPSTVNGSFDIAVNVTGVFDAPHDADLLIAYGFNLAFDNSILSYLGETSGPLFTDLSSNPGIGAQVAGFATNVFIAEGDFTEPLTLAILHFQTINANSGPTSVSISGDSANPDQGLFYLGGSDPISASANLNVATATTPEPASFFLCAFGMVGLYLLRGRFARRFA